MGHYIQFPGPSLQNQLQPIFKSEMSKADKKFSNTTQNTEMEPTYPKYA